MNATDKSGQSNRIKSKIVLGCGLAIWGILLGIAFLGSRLHYEVPNAERPIVLVTSLLILASILSLAAMAIALRIRNPQRDLLILIFLFSVAFRLVLLFSPPFQEVDSYRYIWDGITVANGHSPYRYSPYQVIDGGKRNDPQLESLHKIYLSSESYHTILNRVHYSQVRTLYPPASQAVFAVTVAFVPKSASVSTHLVAMKTAITIFDVGVLFLLAFLLSRLRINVAWCMVYGWNPLIVKEFSNSGHLDSIAVFFVLLSATLLVLFVQRKSRTESDLGCAKLTASETLLRFQLAASGLCLAAGFASKIYPIILFPLFLVFVWKVCSWRSSLIYAIVFVTASLIFFWPMIPANNASTIVDENSEITNKEGLTTFLRHWQMNELAYMLVYQNLRDIDPEQVEDRPWFRILNDNTRRGLTQQAARFTDPEDAPYTLSRVITLGLFSLFYFYVLCRIIRQKSLSPDHLLCACFWILAIFFCLQPTQNPWYWTWAIPFLPFSRNRGWLIYSTFLLIYYYRFALALEPGPYKFLGQEYSGAGLFDFAIVFVEHLPVFFLVAWFGIQGYWQNRRRKEYSEQPTNGTSK